MQSARYVPSKFRSTISKTVKRMREGKKKEMWMNFFYFLKGIRIYCNSVILRYCFIILFYVDKRPAEILLLCNCISCVLNLGEI